MVEVGVLAVDECGVASPDQKKLLERAEATVANSVGDGKGVVVVLFDASGTRFSGGIEIVEDRFGDRSRYAGNPLQEALIDRVDVEL